MASFKYTPQQIDPIISSSLNELSNNFRIDDVDYKYYVYLVNGNGKYMGLTTDAIELLNIKDNLLDVAASGSCVIRNDNDVIERSNLNIQVDQTDNYFARQPKGKSDTYIDEFFFRNDCRDFLYVYIEPELKDIFNNEDIDTLKPNSTLFYVFSIINNKDISTGGEKFKELELIDADLEILREKNLGFSTSYLVKNEAEDLTHKDDTERGLFTGEVIKNLIITGLDAGGALEKTEQNGSVINDSLFDLGTSTLFYSSPADYNVLDDITYVDGRHTSSAYPHDPCILRKDRYNHRYTYISYKDYFKNAIFQTEDGLASGGFAHIETIYVGEDADTQVNNRKRRTPYVPYNNVTIGDFSMVNDYNFSNMSGLDTQSELITTAVHSYQTNDKQFQIDLTNNNVTRSMNDYYDFFVRGEKEKPLFVGENLNTNTFLNQLRKNNINIKNDFSINDKEPDQRLGLGRNSFLKNAIFLNNALSLELKGLTFRSSGKFFSFERKAGVYDSKYDDKVFGTYFIVEVEHTFKKNSYTNSLIGVKTYLFENPDITEVV